MQDLPGGGSQRSVHTLEMNTRRVFLGTAAVIGAGFWKPGRQCMWIVVLKGKAGVWRCSSSPWKRLTTESLVHASFRLMSSGRVKVGSVAHSSLYAKYDA